MVFLVQQGLAALPQIFRGILVKQLQQGLALVVVFHGQKTQAQDQELGQNRVMSEGQPL